MPKTRGRARGRGGRSRARYNTRQTAQPTTTRRSSRPTTAASTAASEATSEPAVPLSALLEVVQAQVQAALEAQQAAIPAPTTPPPSSPPATLGVLPPPQALASVPLTQTTNTVPTPPSNGPAPVSGTPQEPGQTSGAIQQTTTVVSSSGLILSPASSPFPRKLVDKVQSGQYVDMRELLSDNISLLQQLESVHGINQLPAIGPTRPRLREVTTLTTWTYCFLGYAAILTTDPRTRDQLAYARLILREAQRHGGQGWMDYDKSFRQQAAVDSSIRWNTLIPGLQASTIIGRSEPNSNFCTLCRGVDHTRPQCALSYLYPQSIRGGYQARPANRRRPENICISWNKGACSFPSTCTYKHSCATCQQPHMAKDCPRTPATSFYKRPRQPPTSSQS